MATVTLGNLKFNWKGTYNAGTAYAIDDVVSYNGSSYVAKTATTGNLPTVTANWDIMSQAGTNGTNGTDLTTTLTTQGDILYRDGSGLQRLAAGTNGQALLTGGAGANPSWGTIDSGKIKQTHWQWDDQQASIVQSDNSSGTGLEIFSYAFTTQGTNSQFVLDLSCQIGRNNSGNDSGDVYMIAWLQDASSNVKYRFGFYKSGGFRAGSAFQNLAGGYYLEETDAGQYSNTNDWGAMRWTWAGCMGNQSSPDTTPAATSIPSGTTLTLKIRVGGSGSTWYNRTANQTNSMSRSWFRLTELDATL
tara:strand:+ start:44 stop:955 length:912 start_codon:yes stop_codon:yes gene_type:complete